MSTQQDNGIQRWTLKERTVVAVTCTLVGIVCYLASLDYGFLVFDDPAYILNDPLVRHLGFANLLGMFSSQVNAVWYPVARLSHAIDIALFGYNPFWHRVVNLLFHIINAVLLCRLCVTVIQLDRVDLSRVQCLAVSLLAAVVFVVHPQHVEVVAWVSERNELISSCLFLLSLNAYCAYLATGRARYYSGMVVSAFLSMLAKTTVIGLPLVLLLFDFWFNRPLSIRVLAEKLPVFAAGIAVGGVAVILHQTTNPAGLALGELYHLPQRCVLACHNAIQFVVRFLLPFHLTPFYQVPSTVRTLSLLSLPEPLALFVFTVLALLLYYQQKLKWGLVLFGYLALVFPASGIFMFGAYSSGDRYMYMPSAFLMVFIALALAHLLERASARTAQILLVAGITVSIGLFTLTQIQLAYWRDDINLFSYTVKQQPLAGYPRVYLAANLAKQGRLAPEQLAGMVEKAVSIEPVYGGLKLLTSLYASFGDIDGIVRTQARIAHYYPSLSAPSQFIGRLYASDKGTDSWAADIMNQLQGDGSRCQLLQEQMQANINGGHHQDAAKMSALFDEAVKKGYCQAMDGMTGVAAPAT